MDELLATQRELVMRSNKDTASCFIIAKLVSNVDKDTWDAVCAKDLPEGWCALELDPTLAKTSGYAPHDSTTHSAHMVGHLLLAASFFKQLEQENVRAKRSGTSLALVHFGMQNLQDNLEEATHIIHEALQQHGAGCDTLGILDTQSFALILPGAKAFKAQSIVEDILAFCQQKKLSLRAGIAVHLGSECSVKEFLEHARAALHSAEQEQKNIYVYKKPSQRIDDEQSLVHSHEKLFLFGKSDEV